LAGVFIEIDHGTILKKEEEERRYFYQGFQSDG